MQNIKDKKAFTLAEVLVSLSLLGIVATMTITSVYSNMQRKHAVEGVRHSYAILQNLIANSEAVNGPVESWAFPADQGWGKAESVTKFCEQYITPFINIRHTCSFNNNKTKCFAGRGNNYFAPNGYYIANNGPESAYMFVAHNGMTFAFTSHNVGMYNYVKVIVDIDGPNKGGSVMGRDVFIYCIGAYAPDGNGKSACQNPKRKRQGLVPGVPNHCGAPDFFKSTASLRANPSPYLPFLNVKSKTTGTQDCGANSGCNLSTHIIKNNYRMPDYYTRMFNSIPSKGIESYP